MSIHRAAVIVPSAMLRIVTISTRGFLPQTRRLLRSIEKTNGSFTLTVYCDDATAFETLAGAECNIVELKSIRELGVKRARFDLYRHAIEAGDFLYLDSDIVVLESLSALTGFDSMAACPDDLSGCPFISDRRHPWPGDPALENDVYVNSGVLFFPKSARSFIDLLWRRSQQDDLWNRYIIDGKLYDNHFLCAYLNLERPPLRLVDEFEFNWQGFYKDGALGVERRGDSLVNPRTGKKLRLVHFAGIRNVDAFLCSLPANISSLVVARAGECPDSWQTALARFAGSLSGPLGKPVADPFVLRVFDHLLAEVREFAQSSFQRDYSNEPSYFHAPETVRSLVHSRPHSTALWNDLQCGGAYLEGDEYRYLAALVTSIGARSVIEVGAGETSILFRRMGISALSIEPEPGPWFDRASRDGCPCAVVPFDRATLMFEPAPLDRALSAVTRDVDLLFIDSPGGTANRSRILYQFLDRVRARYVLFHDAHRDAANLFQYALDLDLRVVGHQPSTRGFVLLAAADAPSPVMPDHAADAVPSCDVDIEMLEAPERASCGEEFHVRLRILSHSDLPLSSRYLHPIFVAYHWFSSDGRCLVFDGIRTSLPFDIQPGDAATFDVRVAAAESRAADDCELRLTLVQEGVHWFESRTPAAHVTGRIRIEPPAPEGFVELPL